MFEAAARGRTVVADTDSFVAVASGRRSGGFEPVAARTLPRDVVAFTGRAAELQWLAARPPSPVARAWFRSARSAGWRGSARPLCRCIRRTSSRLGFLAASTSFRCMVIRPGVGRWIPPMRRSKREEPATTPRRSRRRKKPGLPGRALTNPRHLCFRAGSAAPVASGWPVCEPHVLPGYRRGETRRRRGSASISAMSAARLPRTVKIAPISVYASSTG